MLAQCPPQQLADGRHQVVEIGDLGLQHLLSREGQQLSRQLRGLLAGIGGFSGRESDVSASWLSQEVRSGKVRWVLADQGGGFGGRLPGDSRAGSKAAPE